jgi:hypothetical protein
LHLLPRQLALFGVKHEKKTARIASKEAV